MDIDHIHEFVYLAETLSFNITAQHFYISQSVLSKHISAMEKELDARLFERDRHHVSLTEAGSMFYLDMLRVINDYQRGLSHLEELNSRGTLALSVGYLRNATRPFLPTFVNYIEEKHPEAKIDITSMEYGELIRAHRSHQVDVILTMRLDPAAEKVCDIVDVYEDEFYLIVSKNHPLADHTAGVSREELVGLDFVLPNQSAYPGFSEFVERLLPEDCDEGRISYYNDIDTLFYMVQSGDYAGFSSGHNIRLIGDRIAFLPISYADTSYHVSGMWLKTIDSRIAELCTEALEVCRKRLANPNAGDDLDIWRPPLMPDFPD